MIKKLISIFFPSSKIRVGENIAELKEIFLKMKYETRWNTDNKLEWGYYFNSTDKKRIKRLANKLKDEGFNTKLNKFDTLYKLHVIEKHIHTATSLQRRNIFFNSLVENDRLIIYEGWDVGRISLEVNKFKIQKT